MRKLQLFLALGLVLAMALPAGAQQLDRGKRAERKGKRTAVVREERSVEEAKALLESRQFEVEIIHVYPQGGGDVSRFNPRGRITVKDSVAEGHLPFFGRAYTLPYGEGGGIEFDAAMKEVQVKMFKKKKRESVVFSFSVPGKNDTFRITIETMGGEGCSVFLVSNNRTQISYSGKLKALNREGNEI